MLVAPRAAADKLADAVSARPPPFETIFSVFAEPACAGGCSLADSARSLKPPPGPTQMPRTPEACGPMSCAGGFLYERLWKLGLVADSYEGVSDCSTADAVDRHSLAPSSAPLTPSQAETSLALATASSMDLPVLLGAAWCLSAATPVAPKSPQPEGPPPRPSAPQRPSQRLREPAGAPLSPATSPAIADPAWLVALRSAPAAGLEV